MKVVIFCGGLGMRIREVRSHAQAHGPGRLPTHPLARHEVLRPLRHTDFILCLGYKAEAIKRYFLDYDEAITNDFVLPAGGARRSSC